MSLTSHLKDPQSPVYKFMREQFPNTRAAAREGNKQLADAKTMKPAANLPYSTIGTALDYRIRYYFAETPLEELVAGKAMVLVTAGLGGAVSEKLANFDKSEFREKLHSTLQQLQPVGRRLEGEQEELLARYCVVLALFEQIFRAGLQPESPLISPEAKTSVSDLLAIAESHWVEDLRTLSWAFYDTHNELLSSPAMLNPNFDGSGDIGGADADFILDNCLVDIKTTINPKLSREMLYQLLGYVLLDYTDQRQINEVAIYFSRQQKLVRWSLGDLLEILANGERVTLEELRYEFQSLLGRP